MTGFAPLPAVARGALWMVLAALSFAILMVSIRALEGRFHAVEIVFVRALVGVFLIVPLVSRSGLAALRTRRLPMHFVRTGFAFAAMLSFYYGLAYVTVADATALSFLIPLFTTLAAAAVLGEAVDAPRWAATAIGFAGALIILRPGFAEISFPVLMVVGSAVFYAGAWTSVKILTRTDAPAVIVFYMNVMMLPVALIPTLIVWVTPDGREAGLLLAMALSGWAAHFCQARAFAAADASAVVPFDFLRLPFGALLAWIVFAEPSDAWTWAGAVVIFSSAWVVTWRESRARAAPG